MNGCYLITAMTCEDDTYVVTVPTFIEASNLCNDFNSSGGWKQVHMYQFKRILSEQEIETIRMMLMASFDENNRNALAKLGIIPQTLPMPEFVL